MKSNQNRGLSDRRTTRALQDKGRASLLITRSLLVIPMMIRLTLLCALNRLFLSKLSISLLRCTARMSLLNYSRNSLNSSQAVPLLQSSAMIPTANNRHVSTIKFTISQVQLTRTKTIELHMCGRLNTCRSLVLVNK